MILPTGDSHAFHLTVVALAYAFIIKSTFAQPLFSLQQYDIPQCDLSHTSHTITIPSKPSLQKIENSNLSIAVFTPSFDLQLVLDHWEHHTTHPAALILLDAQSFDQKLEHTLLSLIQQGHVLALHTNAFEDSEPEHRLLDELAVFETPTGLILPFYTSAQNVNATIPLFRIDIASTRNFTVLKNQVALDSLQTTRHAPVRSPLDFLDRAQTLCLLSRLECHLVAAHDLLSRICHTAVQCLATDPLAQASLARFSALALDDELPHRINASAHFNHTRSVVSRAVVLAAASVSERCVRISLFHPALFRACESSLFQRGLGMLLVICPVVCYSLAVGILAVVGIDVVSRRRRGLFIGLRRAIAKALADRGKIV